MYQTGQQVPVYYDPNDPAKTVETADDLDNSVAIVILYIFGSLFAVGGLIPLVIILVKNRCDAEISPRR